MYKSTMMMYIDANNFYNNYGERNSKISDIVRNKYLEQGFDSLTDDEKFTILLSYSEKSSKIENAVAKLSEIYGTPKMAMDSDPRFLVKDCGINMQSALLLTIYLQRGISKMLSA